MLQLLQVNVSQPTILGERRGRVVESAINKRQIDEPFVHVTYNGIEGDAQADERVINGKRVHGGPAQAIYIYPAEHLPAWSRHIGREIIPGQLGENLTVRGMIEIDIRIGDIFTIGEVVLQVTKPRRPCYKLGMHIGPSAAQFMITQRWPGWYVRVLKPGVMPTHGELTRITTDRSQPTVSEVFAAKMRKDPSVPDID